MFYVKKGLQPKPQAKTNDRSELTGDQGDQYWRLGNSLAAVSMGYTPSLPMMRRATVLPATMSLAVAMTSGLICENVADRPDLIQSELAGLAFDALQQCFRTTDIERFMIKSQ